MVNVKTGFSKVQQSASDSVSRYGDCLIIIERLIEYHKMPLMHIAFIFSMGNISNYSN